jgi:hypothetical protein
VVQGERRLLQHQWPLETAADRHPSWLFWLAFSVQMAWRAIFVDRDLKSRCRNFFASQTHELYHVRYLFSHFLLFKQFILS